ncbi:hypothetical protein ACP4OV_025111 [Aristida adscensionis]
METQHQEVEASTLPAQSLPAQLDKVGGSTLPAQSDKVGGSKRKRIATTNRKRVPAAKRVKSPIAEMQTSSTCKKRVRPPTDDKQRTSPAMKRLRSPVVTRSPMLRLVMSPVVVGGSPPRHRPSSSPSRSAWDRSPSPEVPCSPGLSSLATLRTPLVSPVLPDILDEETRPRSSNHIVGSTPRKGGKPRKLRSSIWKEVEPIYIDGRIVEARCTHCNARFPAARNSGTSHIHRHLGVCQERAKIHEVVDKLRSSATEVGVLADWKFSAEVSRGELVRMIVLHELPFSLVEYDGFIR